MGRSFMNTQERKKSKNQLRRERAKLLKQRDHNAATKLTSSAKVLPEKAGAENTTVRASSAGEVDTHEKDTLLEEAYKDIFEKFDPSKLAETEQNEDDKKREDTDVKTESHILIGSEAEDDAEVNDDEEIKHGNQNSQVAKSDTNNEAETPVEGKNLSKRKFKKLYSIPLAVLKGESKYPELIDWMDANSPDPRLHIYLKTLPNSVSIPSHWQSKKSFLSSKRGIERPPFELPEFIRNTGILEMRNIVEESENDQSTLKQRMRERVQPKSGQLDIDYNKLHDAFFKYQKKPPLLKFGELYTESTNNDDLVLKDKISHFKVGVLSPRLKHALGMVDEKGTLINRLPPWYYKMKEIGPPPSYPYMKISTSGKISFDNPNELNIGPPITTEHWGMLVNDLDDSGDEEALEENDVQTPNSNTQANNGFDRSKGDILLTAFGEGPAKGAPSTSEKSQAANDGKPKRLFTVLQSTRGGNNDRNNNKDSIFGSQAASYRVPH
ncbi:hypothetical protein PMKS-003924 [Pichia membranifaciens]|uniref:PSP proline-rich domain-containing protein n=1 Tax=Pichia membranifaciens TaxID=4926 RepID=A0A1Q2YM10_9ASCO|nr:hypothetical protein PMKS-003924 [Pichia membranifaciens]